MSQPFIGEIRMFAGNFAPAGWEFCEGQLLSISENDALFALIGTTYGGDGQTTFALPDLRGRIPIHQGNGFAMGESGGAETVTLTLTQLPAHGHALVGSTSLGNSPNPANQLFARSQSDVYAPDFTGVNMNPQAISATGGSQPHENMMPFLCVNFIISLFGIFPSQT